MIHGVPQEGIARKPVAACFEIFDIDPLGHQGKDVNGTFSHTHVVHVVRQYVPNIGGLEDVVRNLARCQKDRFASLKIVTLDRLFNDPKRALARSQMIDGIEVVRIPFGGSSRYPLAPKVFQAAAGADLIHVHGVDFFFDAFAMSSLWNRTPLVATTHGGFFHTRNHALLKKIWFRTLTRFSANRYQALACCSASDLELFAAIAPQRAVLVENGVDLEKFGDAAARESRKGLVTIGRFSRNKHLERLLDVLACLRDRDAGWQLDIIGAESDLSAAEIGEMASAHGVRDGLRVLTGLSDKAIRHTLARSSLFVSASEYEGFGLALIEAMSAGLLPVVHPNTAFRSLADRHDLICLSDFAAPKETAAAILQRWQVAQDAPQLRAQIMKEVSRYSWQTTSAEYDRLYARALRRPG